MARILITGAGGFIGSNLIPFLKDKGHFVRAVDIDFPEMRAKLGKRADEVLTIDLREQVGSDIATKEIDYVIHLAADMGGVGYFHKEDYYPYLNNMQIDMNILRSCEKNNVKRLFYSSSACIYPIHLQMDLDNVPSLSENMIFPANSDQMYGWEKLMMTMLCQRSPIDCRVGIFHTIFGPYQEIEGERMKFPTAIATKVLESKKTGQPIEIWGNGSQIRSFCNIYDAMEKIYLVLTDNYKGPVNIGSDEALTVKEVAEMCCEITDTPKNFIFNDKQPSGVLARNCDNTRFEQIYGYKNKFTTKEGFEKLINWLRGGE